MLGVWLFGLGVAGSRQKKRRNLAGGGRGFRTRLLATEVLDIPGGCARSLIVVLLPLVGPLGKMELQSSKHAKLWRCKLGT